MILILLRCSELWQQRRANAPWSHAAWEALVPSGPHTGLSAVNCHWWYIALIQSKPHTSRRTSASKFPILFMGPGQVLISGLQSSEQEHKLESLLTEHFTGLYSLHCNITLFPLQGALVGTVGSSLGMPCCAEPFMFT